MYQPVINAPAGHVGDPVIGKVVESDKKNNDDMGPPQQPTSFPPTGPPASNGGGNVNITDLEARFKALDGM